MIESSLPTPSRSRIRKLFTRVLKKLKPFSPSTAPLAGSLLRKRKPTSNQPDKRSSSFASPDGSEATTDVHIPVFSEPAKPAVAENNSIPKIDEDAAPEPFKGDASAGCVSNSTIYTIARKDTTREIASSLGQWIGNKELQLDPARLSPELLEVLVAFREKRGQFPIQKLYGTSRLSALYDWKVDAIIPAFRNIFQLQILFYIQHLHPYMYDNLLEETKDDTSASGSSSSSCPELDLPHTLGHCNDQFAEYYNSKVWGIVGDQFLNDRWRSGMFRAGQLELITRTFERLRAELLRLIASGKGLHMLYLTIMRFDNVLRYFFCDERFRSERLEVLIRRYLDVDEVNEEVAQGVQTSMAIMYRKLHGTEGMAKLHGGLQDTGTAYFTREYNRMVEAYQLYGEDRKGWLKVEKERCVFCNFTDF
ncbi:hypothetical protein BJ508DRAFT_375885 [Ascobolus immersus RN42]|uniref:Uncharacterized protein n=1 Tax=Ascobolus immersus RN42 TaxID=1160509 RepID=A0A3N4ID84_ASCIM|nr:hypothetical protein BJ508DRAFT_375885 [Ascobolus immersus RN42]